MNRNTEVEVLPKPSHSTLVGCVMMVLASAIVAGNTLIAQVLGAGSLGSAPVHPLMMVAGRFVFAFALIAMIAAPFGVGFSRRNLPIAFMRTCCGWGGTLCNFAAVALASMGEVTAISFLNPMIGMCLAWFFLHEPVRRVQWVAALVSLLGTVAIIRPDFGALHPAHVLALICACLWGAETCFIKRLIASGQGRLQILLTNNAMGTLLSCSVAAFVFTMPSALQIGLLVLIAAMTLASQFLIMQALRLAAAGIVLPIYYSTLIFSVLLDYTVHSIWPDRFDMLGGLMILASSVTLGLSRPGTGGSAGKRH